MDVHHETVTFDRSFPAPPARLFRAYTDLREREIWSAPHDDAVIQIERADIRTGGTETCHCGSAGDLRWVMDITYHQVEEDRLICLTEELREGDALMTVALITFEFRDAEGGGTHLHLTDQITSLVGKEGADGHKEGYTQALARLTDRLVPA